MDKAPPNIDPVEIDKFKNLADEWWTPKGPLKGLHDINPVRLKYMSDRVDVRGKTILDIGCGGGILSQALAQKGGKVTGIDLNPAALAVARMQAKQSGHAIIYFNAAVEDLTDSFREAFDVVACMEVLEHVPRPQSIVNACKKLVKPGGHVFFATLNRTWTAYLLAIVTAEHILRIVGKGTHAYKRFIKPNELSNWATQAGLTEKDLSGIRYIPFGPICYLNKNTRVNYMMHFKKEGMGDG